MPPVEHPLSTGSPVRGSTRSTPRALAVLAAVLLLARVATGILEAVHPTERADLVSWCAPEQAAARAREEHKLLLYDFSAAWCQPCRAQEREVFSDAQAARNISERFIPVQVMDRLHEDGRNPALVDSLQRRYKVSAFPTLVVADPETGRSETAAGFQDRVTTLHFLDQAFGRLWRGFEFKIGGGPRQRP